ncbi:MAG: HAMP domain-containing histidine kinase [Hyphomicrobiales bacterium]
MAKHKQISISLRLAIGLSIGVAILWLGAAVISTLVMQNELSHTLDGRLKKSAKLILPLAIYSHKQSKNANADPLHLPGLDSIPYIILDEENRLIIFSDHPKGLKTPKLKIVEGFSNIGTRRQFGYVDRSSGYSIQVFETISDRNKLLAESVKALLWPLAAIIPLVIIIIWLVVRMAMRPLKQLSSDIAKRDGNNLTPLTTHAHPKELAPIANEVAELLTRLDAALKAERSFAASSAHELRTPIAGALAQTQRLAIELGQKTGAKRLKEIEKSLRNLSDLAEKLLQLSRLESGFAKTTKSINLMPVLNLVITEFKPKLNVNLNLAQGVQLQSYINEDAFFIAFRNLVQNAYIHGDGKTVEIDLPENNIVIVRNKSEALNPEILAKIGEAFVRGGSRSEGSGLGLSIIRSIMLQAGGELLLNSPATGKADGFEAILKLPQNRHFDD